MTMMFVSRTFWVLAGLLSSSSAAVAADAVFTVQALGEAPIRASALELAADSEQLNVTAGGQSRALDLSEVVAIDVAPSGEIPVIEADVDVLLADGSRFVGRLVEGAEDSLGIEIAALGRVLIPLEQVRAIAFGSTKERSDPASLGKAESEDVLYRRGRGDADRVSGTCTQIGKDALAFASDVGDLSFKPAELIGIVLATAEVEPFPIGRGVDVDLVPSGSLRARWVSLASQSIVLETHFKDRVTLDPSRVLRIRMRSDRFRYLSDLEPLKVVETPFLGASDDFLFPFRRDLSVTGKPLFVGGVHHGKGLGVHSRSRLEWELDGKYASFECGIGICDEVASFGGEGSVVARVFVDDEKAYESAMIRGGMPAQRVPVVSLAGKKRLAIEIDFGDRGDVGDRAAIVDPLLVRASP